MGYLLALGIGFALGATKGDDAQRALNSNTTKPWSNY